MGAPRRLTPLVRARGGAVVLGLLAASFLVAARSGYAVQDEGRPPGAAVQVSSSCARCHASAPDALALRAPDGETVAPYDLWSGSMMAHSAIDPLWRAAVSVEVAATPAAREAIEAKCLSCHAPMATRVGLDGHGLATPIDVLHHEGTLGELARDGVSCTICHGIAPDGLGTPASFSAGFELDPWNRLFGPHREPFVNPMQRATGFTPTHGEHVMDSALCGSCHTLETAALRPDGTPTGHVLLEQAPYLEWRNSDFDTERAEPGPRAASCQSCHLPTVDDQGRPIETRIARNPMGGDFPFASERAPIGRHVLVGGNALVLGILADNAEELGITERVPALRRARLATLEQLRTRTARVELRDVRVEQGRVAFSAAVQNLTGHKLPTAHPTRRAFLRAVVRDGAGEVIASVGLVDERGRVLGADGLPLASELPGGPVQPHRDLVRGADELVEYRSVMADEHGEPTHLLLRGATWLADTRLLPAGWSADHADAERTAPVGTGDDADFGPGGDRVRFDLDLGGRRPASVEVELCYQTLSPRWAAELLSYDTDEVRRFARMYAAADPTPVVLATARVEL